MVNNNLYILYLFILSSFITSAQTVENLEYHSEMDKVIITYDLVNCAPEERYYISLSFEEQNTSNKLYPKSISGDISNLSCGNKKISWDVKKDYNTISGKYYPVLSINKSVNGVKDIDGNVYKTVQIGTQLWFAENLKTSKYNDGSPLPNIPDKSQWQNNTTGAWCYYDNDESNNAIYGKLYNWYAVSKTTNGNKNVCPTGWHVPTDAEWTVLTDYLGGYDLAGGKMKEVGTTNWRSPNTEATNTSLFTGLPGGYRDYNGNYKVIGYGGSWWSSKESDTLNAWGRSLDYFHGDAYRSSSGKGNGLSVRCLRD